VRVNAEFDCTCAYQMTRSKDSPLIPLHTRRDSARLSAVNGKSTNTTMKSYSKNYGPFRVMGKQIRFALKYGMATLKCETQIGTTPMGRPYKLSPQWWIQTDGSPCASGPWTMDAIRKFHL
jgi:hypothetical protein